MTGVMQSSVQAQHQTGNLNQRVPRSVVLFAKALTASDCCTSVSKGGRITIPRVAVEKNLPSVADKRHHEVVVLDNNDTAWTFIIKSWPNGGENKRVYVMEKTAPYMRRNKMKIGDVIAITRRPDMQLGVEHNSEAALYAVSQGRGRSVICPNLSAAETIAAQRCLRNQSCSKALGHAGFCDNGKSAAALRHNSLAGLAAAAEQASNGSAGYGQVHMSPKIRSLAADRSPSSQQPQGMLVGKVLTKADVEACRVVLPRMAMEANMPEVVDADVLHVDLHDEEGSTWPATLLMSSTGIAKRMFILEKIGAFMRQHNLQPGDCVAIKRTFNDALHIVINPDSPADGREAPAVSSKDSETLPVTGLVSDSADSMDVSRRQSVRRRRFKSGCEVNFARMLSSSLKSNGLADPFRNNEDNTFPEEQLPPPLQEHDTAAADQLPRKGRQNERAARAGLMPAGLTGYHQQQQAAHSQHLHYPSYFDMWPAHAAAVSHAFGANMGFGSNCVRPDAIRNLQSNGGAAVPSDAASAAASVFQSSLNMSAYQMASLPAPQPLSAAAAAASGAVPSSSLLPASDAVLPGSAAEPAAVATATSSDPQEAPGSTALPQDSTAAGIADIIMHGSLQDPNAADGVPALSHSSMVPANAQATARTAGIANSTLPGCFVFLPSTSAAGGVVPSMYCSSAADASRLAQSQLGLYAQHLPPFAHAGTPAGLGPFLPTPFALNMHQAPAKPGSPAALSAAAGVDDLSSAAAGGAGDARLKRKSPGSAQERGGCKRGETYADAGAPVIARRAAHRPPPQVPHGSLGKGSGTPKNLARSHVLVAKVLTNSDTHGRIILPRVSVEANLTFLMGYRSYSLPVRDHDGRKWEFVIKSWANGTENRRVYVLEQTVEYLKVNGLGVGDAVGICTNKEGDLVVDSNSDEVRQATVRPTYGAAAVQHIPAPAPGKAESFSSGAPGRCSRSPCCTKFGGHSGFCCGPRALQEGNAARLRLEEAEEATDQLQRRPSAAAAQEEAEDLSEAQEVVAKDMAVGTLLITHLTQQDLRAKEILLPKQAVEANILPALTYSLLKFKVVDDRGSEHEVLLRSFVHGHGETMYLLDRLAALLCRANAQAGDMLMLSRDEDGPVKVHLEAVNYDQQASGMAGRHSSYCLPAVSQDGSHAYEGKAELGDALICNRTEGCAKSAGHQGFCSGHKGFRRRFLEDSPAHASGEWSDGESGSDSGQDGYGSYHRNSAQPSHRQGAGKRKGQLYATQPAKRMTMTQEVQVTCGSSSGLLDLRRGCIALRAAQHGQIVNLEFTPAEFEQHVIGCQQDWRQSLLVEVGQHALPLGPWLQQQGICTDDQGRTTSFRPSRFAQEAGPDASPSWSSPSSHSPARVHRASRPSHPLELTSSGRAHSMPSRVKPASHTHLARFASKPVPRAYVPKKARSRAAGRAEPLTSQDSLAAEVLLSLCPSGYREHSSDVGDGAVDSAAPMAEESESEQRQTETVEPVLQAEQKTMQTQRTLSIPLVDSRGHGGMASMDPAGSAVLLTDMYTADPAHLLGANDTS